MSSGDGPSPASAQQTAGVSLSLRLSLGFFLTAFLLVLTASAILYIGTLTALQSVDDQVIDKRAAAIATLLSKPVIDAAMLDSEVNDDDSGPRQIFIRVLASSPAMARWGPSCWPRVPRQTAVSRSCA